MTEEFRNSLAAMLASTQGQKVLWEILTRCQVFSATDSTDYAVLAKENGRRDVGLWLLASITEVNSEAFLRMMTASQKEYLNRDTDANKE